MKEKERKTYHGEKNDKEKTMQKLLLAVGIVLKQKGYTGLTVTSIANAAETDRKLIKLYFGSVENLIETYIKQKDYWVTSVENAKVIFDKTPENSSQSLLKTILHEQLKNFLSNTEMQKAVVWQISEPSDIMSLISREREKISNLFFQLSDKELKDKEVDLRAVASLLVAGIYYLVLHAKNTDSTFCEITLDEEGFERIKKAVDFVIDATYSKS